MQNLEKSPEQKWAEDLITLLEYPNETDEFDDFVNLLSKRLYEKNTCVERAADIINKNLSILYYRRHPREDLKLIMAII